MPEFFLFKRKELLLSYLLVCLFMGFAYSVKSQFLNIKNDSFWKTMHGQPIYSQGGGIFKFKDKAGYEKYYWYGVQYKEASLYHNDPSVTLQNATFQSVTCYSSTDLVNWYFEGDVVTKSALEKNMRVSWVGRLGVAYISELKRYAMLVQFGNQVLVALSDSPDGEFVWHQRIDMTSRIGTSNTGDQTVFTDEDTGKSYLVYSYGRGRNKIYVSEIGVKDGKVDLLDCTQVFKGASREGNCMFKYHNKYYMVASNIYGWDASFAYYLVADNIRGPYKPVDEMLVMNGSEDDYAHVTQTGFFVNVKGIAQETILYCGDRWANFAGNGLGYNQWFPLSFENDVPYFNSLSSWSLNAKTGQWQVFANNNYVKNGSFEADRNHIPSHVKPVQTGLLGWHITVLKGNKISLDSTISPVLNYFNTNADRKVVIGEKSLCISDEVSFERKVYQVIKSTPYVKLEDGLYTLSSIVKNSKGFHSLEMFASSNNKTQKVKIGYEGDLWKAVSIKNVEVKNGQAEIGFWADGEANAFCYVDDVSFIKQL